MGSGSRSSPDSFSLTDKAPPSYGGCEDTERYQENSVFWDATISNAALRRALAFIGQLTGLD